MADTRRVMNCQLGSLAAAAAAGGDRQLSWFYREATHSNTIISVLPYTMCDRSYTSFTSDFSQAWKSATNAFSWLKILQIKSRFTFIGQKNTNAWSITIFILTFSLHEDRGVSGNNEGARTGGCNMSDDSISAHQHIPALVPLQVGSS